MHYKFLLKLGNLVALVALLLLGGCATGPTNFLPCSSTRTADGEVAFADVAISGGRRYVGEFYCADGKGRTRGKGTLFTPDGLVTKATWWTSEFYSGEPKLGGEVERHFPDGQIDRFHYSEFTDWYYELPAFDGSGPLSGPIRLSYTVFPSGDDLWKVRTNSKEALVHRGPVYIQRHKIDCGAVPTGYLMVGGSCKNGKPDGSVFFYTPDGLQQLKVSYVNGRPSGTMRYQKITIQHEFENGNKFFIPNIVSSTNPVKNCREHCYLHDIVQLETNGVRIATGTPKVTETATTTSLEFDKLDRYTEYSNYGNEAFFGGFTTNLSPNGDGKCEMKRFDSQTHQLKSNSIGLENCSYAGNGYMLRSDQHDANRRAYAEEARKQIQRESDERWAENNRRREEEARQSAREDRQAARSGNNSIGAYILQKGAENTAILNSINHQTNAAVEQTNRVLAAQAVERERSRAAQEVREAERRRKAERVRVTDAAKSARVEDARSNHSVAASTTNAATTGKSTKTYTYVDDATSQGTGKNESEGCAEARKQKLQKPDVKRIISTGTCRCNDISNLNAKVFVCTIPYKVEIVSPYDPNAKYGDSPSQGTSK